MKSADFDKSKVRSAIYAGGGRILEVHLNKDILPRPPFFIKHLKIKISLFFLFYALQNTACFNELKLTFK